MGVELEVVPESPVSVAVSVVPVSVTVDVLVEVPDGAVALVFDVVDVDDTETSDRSRHDAHPKRSHPKRISVSFSMGTP
ncbi:MAG: hypothetical protein KTR31_09980 [Myxococcales bacterium]|nr:hypothetical protein [Myxococcales bacterium]